MQRALPVFLLALAACATDDSSGGDSAGGGDTGPGTADELPWTGDCPGPSGFADGASFAYEYNATWEDANDRSGTWTAEIHKEDDGTYTVNGTVSVSGSNNTYEEENVATYGCDADGLWLLTLNVTAVTTVYDPYESSQDYEFTAPILIMPANTEEGTRWTSTYDGVYTNELGARRTADASYDWLVEGVDAVDTPAGSWNAQRWTKTSSLGTATNEWRVSGLGMVANTDSNLTDYAPK
jgi:hypothetical protein